jgi:peptidoglycan/LPS O-acetylase OafA/YrhL
VLRHARRWHHAADALGALWLILVLARLVLPPDRVLYPLSIVVLLCALSCFIIFVAVRRRTTKRALARVMRAAADERGKRLVREYQHYLREAP